eukprot:TRINITY_DN11292_c0_g1_i1.p1 TRINITY_DN11292_c0_g1~~TRINITY_DN11292_c0_g1_i1.p1  ORF type:complete len:520 (-),score=142.97 TRINITY_DN11292_c0_g1_i1:37-1596(-)
MADQSVGIDFGTVFTSVAIIRNNLAEVVADSQGERQLPCYVGFFEDENPLVGLEAERKFSRNWQNTIFDLKLMLGKSFEEAQAFKSRWPFKFSPGKKSLIQLEVNNKGSDDKYSPQQVVSMILSKIKETAENYAHRKVSRAVITVPVNMASEAKDALHEAASLSGFSDVHLIPDPIAALLAYELDAPDTTGLPKHYIVVDFGSSLTVTLTRVQSGLISIIKSEASDLKASTIENEIFEQFVREFKSKSGLDCRESRKSKIRLLTECERAKKVLSQIPETSVQIDGLYEGMDFSTKLSRAKFEGMCDYHLKKVLIPIQTLVSSIGGVSKIDGVIMTGGGCKIPKIQTYVKQFFSSNQNTKIFNTIETTDVNARGAAIHASLLAVRNPMLKHKKQNATTSTTIGLSGADGNIIPIIVKDTPLPVKISRTFGVPLNQTSAYIAIYEGESSLVSENKLIAEMGINELTPAATSGDGATTTNTSSNSITATFIMNENGSLNVNLSNGKKVEKLNISSSSTSAPK